MNIVLRGLTAGVLLTAASAPAGAQSLAALTVQQVQRIDEYAGTAMTAMHIPGMALAVVRDGNVVYRKGFGVKNAATKAPVEASTTFEIGSVTKQFTATAVLQLAEQGKLRLDDPLGKYVTAYGPAREVTIRQLLNQVTGIPNYTDAGRFESIAAQTKPSFARMIGLIAKKPPAFAPGTKWAYSNTNYVLLGKVVEAASHESYSAYVFDHVIKPAGMNHTVTMDEERGSSTVATGYRPTPKGGLAPAPAFGAGWAWSAGYLVSNVDDLAKWDDAFFGGKIISPGDVNLATTPFRLPDGKSTGYGMGWIDDTQDGQRRIWHNGGTFGFSAANVTYPDEHVAIIVLANALVPTQAIAARVFEVLYPPSIKAAAGEDSKITARAKDLIRRFQTGNIDRSALDKRMNDALTPAIVDSVKAQLSALGDPARVTFSSKTAVGTSTVYVYRVDFASASLNLQLSIDAAGKINGAFFKPA